MADNSKDDFGTDLNSVEVPVEIPVDLGLPEFGSDAVVDLLGKLGYKFIAINPGSSFRGLHDSIVNHHGNKDPKLLLCLHEEVAVSLAHGYAKASTTPIAVAIHDLVGLMHASMAVYDTFVDRTALLILGGSGPRDRYKRRPIDWIHSADSQAQLIREFVKWDDEPSPSSAFVPSVMKAHQIAHSWPYGPTYVSLDCALQEEEVDEQAELDIDPTRYPSLPTITPDPVVIAKTAEVLCSTQNPLVIGGRISRIPSISEALESLVEKLGAAYIDERNSVSFPTAHHLNCNGLDSMIDQADVILSIDVSDLPSLLERKGSTSAAGKFIIDLSFGDIDAKSWSNNSSLLSPRDIHLICDPLLGIRAITKELAKSLDSDSVQLRTNFIRAKVNEFRKERDADQKRHLDDAPISQVRLVSELWNAVKDIDWLLLLRNTRTWPEGIWNFTGSGQFLGHSGGGGVGYGPGAMVGGALAAQEQGKLGVGIIGDGDFLMASSALWTATHYRIPMLMVVNDNNSFYNDEPHQARVAKRRGRPVDNSWIGMRISDPAINISELARSYGCWSIGPIDDPSKLKDAVKQGLKAAVSGKTAVVHVLTAR